MKIKLETSFVLTLSALLIMNDIRRVAGMLLCAVMHEAGHIIAMRIFGVRVRILVLGLFGGTLVPDKKLISYKKEVAVSLAGPAVNLIFSAVIFFIMRQGFTSELFFLFLTSGFYGLFNLLPIYSLDGGRAIFSLIATKKELYDAERITNTLSRVTLLVLASASLYLITVSAFNISLLIVTLLFYAESLEGHIISGYEFCRRTS